MKRATAWIICFVFLGPLTAANGEDGSKTSSEPMHLFLLVGQSNMAGRGKVTLQDQQPHPQVVTLDKSGEWAPAIDPLHFDKPAIVGVGLGRTFAIEYAKKHPGVTVGLIPCAVGGSPIAAWEPGGYHRSTRTHPWDDMLPRARKALESGVLKGVLWHQGESDSNEKAAPAYESKLHDLIARLRESLEAPNAPFIAGQMGQFEERPWNNWKKMVDEVHRELPNTVANTAFVSSDGLTHKGDEVHFDADSYRELGRRYLAAFEELVAR